MNPVSATAHSVNTIRKLVAQVGLGKVVDVAHRMNHTTQQVADRPRITIRPADRHDQRLRYAGLGGIRHRVSPSPW
jgi:hypothetical protein